MINIRVQHTKALHLVWLCRGGGLDGVVLEGLAQPKGQLGVQAVQTLASDTNYSDS